MLYLGLPEVFRSPQHVTAVEPTSYTELVSICIYLLLLGGVWVSFVFTSPEPKHDLYVAVTL